MNFYAAQHGAVVDDGDAMRRTRAGGAGTVWSMAPRGGESIPLPWQASPNQTRAGWPARTVGALASGVAPADLGAADPRLRTWWAAGLGARKNRAARALAERNNNGVLKSLKEVRTHALSQDYAAAAAGMRPGLRLSIPDAAIRVAIVKSSLGYVLVARSPKGVCAILLGDSPSLLERDLRECFSEVRLLGSDADTESLAAEVARVVENPRLSLDLPLDLRCR